MQYHTVEAYLNRRTTEELQAFLQYCMQKNLWEQYADSVPLIFDILQKRGLEIQEIVITSWERFLAISKGKNSV